MIVLVKWISRMKRTKRPRAASGLMRLLYHAAVALSIVASAHAATLLPNGKQQFTDANGAPYASGSVCFYVPGTTTAKQTWQDALETVANTTPCITLDSAGRAIIYGTGQYREQLFDANSNLVWDQLTQDSPTLTPLYYGSTSTGSANAQSISLVGAMQPAAYGTGQFYEFIAGFTNTGATTLAVTTSQTTLSATNVYKQGASGPTALTGGEIVAGNVVTVIYDGTQFQLLNNPTPTTGAIVPSQLPFNEVTTGSTVSSPVSLTGYVASGAITIDLPLTTSVTKAYQLYVFAQGGAITLSPNVADKIQGGSAGVSYTVASGASAMIATDASGNWWLFYTGSASGGTNAALQEQMFTTSGTFTAPATTNYRFYVTGGGGGGAGANTGGGGGGGGAGGTSLYQVLVTAGSSVTVTVGGGGNGGPSTTAGSAGVASSVVVNGVTVTSGGGAGGGLGSAVSAPGTLGIAYGSGGNGGIGGTATPTALSDFPGGAAQSGGGGVCQYSGWNSGGCMQGSGGGGGASYWGGGGPGEGAYDGTHAVATAGAGQACGSGGGGATKGTDSGGAGAGGCVAIQWVQ